MSCFTVQILPPSGRIIEVDTCVGDSISSITIDNKASPNILLSECVAQLPSDFNDRILFVTSGIIPVKNIIGGSGINVSSNSGNYTVAVTGNFGLTGEEVDDRVASLLSQGSNILINYDDLNNSLTISTSGLQPSGNYSIVGHAHTNNDIIDFNNSVSGLLPVKNINAGSGISVTNNSGDFVVSVTGQFGLTSEQVDDRVANLLVGTNYINLNYDDDLNKLVIQTSGLQPSGNYSVVGHSHVISDVSGLQLALDNKQPSGLYASSIHNHTSSDITDFNSSVSGLIYGIYAPLLSPSFSGIPTVPTAISGTNSTQIASTAFVRNEISNLVDSAPSTLDTLNELASALNDDPNFATTIASGLAGKASLVHSHSSSDITNFDNSVSGLLTVTNVTGSSGILVNNSGTTYNVSSSGLAFLSEANFSSLSVTGVPVSISGHTHSYTDIINFASGVDNTVSTLLIGGNYINLNYDSVADTLTISSSGLQPSGNYANSVHSHGNISSSGTIGSTSGLLVITTSNGTLTTSSGINSSYITNFNSSVSGLLPSISGSGYVSSNFTNNIYSISVTGLQPSGNYSLSGHTHTSSNITDFNSSVSGLLPVKDINGSGYINISNSSGNYTISVSGLQPSGNYANSIHSHGNLTSSGTIIGGDPINYNHILLGTNGQIFANTAVYNSQRLYDGANAQWVLEMVDQTVQWSGWSGYPDLFRQSIGAAPLSHSHTSVNITDFNSSVSGLLPVKNIVAGTGIGISSSSGIYTINSTVNSVAEAASVITTVFNKTANTINKGSVVYINGGQGDQPTIQLAIASTEMGSSKTYGIVQNNIPSMSAGKVVVAGALTGFNTDQYNPTSPHGDVNGTTLWLSPSVSGAMTTTKPSAPYHMVSVGTIVRTHQNEGVVEVRIQNGFELEELHNVAISGLVDQQSLVYNSGLSLWENKTLISNYISDFNSSVSGLLPITDIVGGSNITISQSGTIYTVAVTGSLGLTTEEVDDRVSNLLVAGSGISLDYNDGSDTLTIHNTSISPDEIEEYSTTSNFPASGNLNILYIATDTGQMFKWDGEFYYENGPQGASTGSHSDQHASDGSDPIQLREYVVPSFTSNTNNLAHNNKDILYLSSDANNRELSGLVAPSGCNIKLLVNTNNSNTIILDHQSTNSDPSNRFMVYTGADYYLLAGYSVSILYDTNASRWRVL